MVAPRDAPTRGRLRLTALTKSEFPEYSDGRNGGQPLFDDGVEEDVSILVLFDVEIKTALVSAIGGVGDFEKTGQATMTHRELPADAEIQRTEDTKLAYISGLRDRKVFILFFEVSSNTSCIFYNYLILLLFPYYLIFIDIDNAKSSHI